MPNDGTSFVRWFRDAEKAEKNRQRRAPQMAKKKASNRKRNKIARQSRKKNR